MTCTVCHWPPARRCPGCRSVNARAHSQVAMRPPLIFSSGPSRGGADSRKSSVRASFYEFTPLVFPKTLKPGRRQLCVAHRVLDVPVTEIGLAGHTLRARVGRHASIKPRGWRTGPRLYQCIGGYVAAEAARGELTGTAAVGRWPAARMRCQAVASGYVERLALTYVCLWLEPRDALITADPLAALAGAGSTTKATAGRWPCWLVRKGALRRTSGRRCSGGPTHRPPRA